MKVSVVVAVYNEEESIKLLLESLLRQSRKPDEIVVVDNGSQDKTVEILKSFSCKYPKIRIFVHKGTLAQGRNLAVRKASYKIIAQIDAGCVAKKDWLEKIITPFTQKTTGVVAGYYKILADSCLQKAAAPFLGVLPKRYDIRSFLPCGRSIAFRKSVWEKIGGYSEKLDRYGEDTLFNYQVIQKGFKMIRVPEALVYWQVPGNLKDLAIKFFRYAYGDFQTAIWWHPQHKLATHNIKVLGIFVRYFLGIFLLILAFRNPLYFYLLIICFLGYLFWSILKLRDLVTGTLPRLIIPLIQLTSDLCIMAGFAFGLIKLLV